MSDWKYLNERRIKQGYFASDESYGFNGAFEFMANNTPVRVIASDGMGWQHVSVTIRGSRKPPHWDVMCFVKDLFWELEDCVVQFHPPHSRYISNHDGCLHLWRSTAAEFPMPPMETIGIKGVKDGDLSPAQMMIIHAKANQPPK